MRVKRAVHARKRKKAYFEAAKGYRGGRSRLWRTV
ncbi:MAG: 50S ribosomal protein L20, partial [SAR324 cluster bacterium]|nr:50S ribosomal protein L20 [SAR324 cluster bacterium]